MREGYMDPNQQEQPNSTPMPDVPPDTIPQAEASNTASPESEPVSEQAPPVGAPFGDMNIQPQVDGFQPAINPDANAPMEAPQTMEMSNPMPMQSVQQNPQFAPIPNQSDGMSPAAIPVPAGKKPKKKLIVALIAGIGGLILVGVTILVLVLFVFGGGRINSISELRDAIENQKAINCTVTMSIDMHGMSILGQEDGGEVEMIIRADDGWSNLYVSVPTMFGMEAWLIRDGDNYTQYTRIMGMNVRTTVSESEFAEVADDMLGEMFDVDQISSIDCEPNRRANFDLPSGVNWEDQDFADLDSNFGEDDDEWDFDFDSDEWDHIFNL